jgi:oligo-1,6-glucosidase
MLNCRKSRMKDRRPRPQILALERKDLTTLPLAGITLYMLIVLGLAVPMDTVAAARDNTSKPDMAETTTPNGYTRKWWKEAVVYQIYPRSFKDSNGDGIGDLPGITSQLDYLQGLGVNVIWLSPHFDSPNADNGYDIRDYRKVMKEFGTMDDFDAMLKGIKQRHMKLIIDLVVNHTSDEHTWFVESRKAKDNPYRNYYIWRPGKPGPGGAELPPNNDSSFFFGSAWQKDPATNEYYLHYFAVKQPDLNWDNPTVRNEVYDLMKFWLDKGVDGFRMDVIPLISKNQAFPDLTPEQLKYPEFVYANGPHMHEYLQEMNRNVMAHYDVMTVGEALGITLQQTPSLVDERRRELNMIFNFDSVRINRNGKHWKPWTLPELKAVYDGQDAELDVHSWNTIFLSNHDNPRLVSSFGDDSAGNRVPSAKLLATMIFTLKGTPFIYQGDELGMTNYPFHSIIDFDDIEVKNGYKADVLTHNVSAADYLANLRKTSRDNARTPMQWDGSANGGFTTAAKPWLAVNPNYTGINAKEELANPGSVYHYYRQMIELRTHSATLIYGDYQDLDPQNPSIFAYTRVLGSDKYLVILNWSGSAIQYTLPSGLIAGRLQISNLVGREEHAPVLHLQAWEARVYRQ